MNYTFHIKEGVTFHDGTELTADDVAYSIQRVLRIHDPNGPSWMLEQIMTSYLSYYVDSNLTTFIADNAPPQWMLDAIGETDGAYILTEDDNRAVAEASITVVDDMTVNFRLNKPFPAFLKIVAYTVMSIVSKDYVEDNGGIVDGEHNVVMDETTCGTGPYILPEGGWEFGTKIHLVRNDDYWGSAPALKDVYIITATDENTRILMLQAGDADSIAMSIEYESMFPDTSKYEHNEGTGHFRCDLRRVQHGDQHDPGGDIRQQRPDGLLRGQERQAGIRPHARLRHVHRERAEGQRHTAERRHPEGHVRVR